MASVDGPDGAVTRVHGIRTDMERALEYLYHLKAHFAGTRVAGLADAVIRMLDEPSHAARIERDVLGIRGTAVSDHYINSKLHPTWRSRFPHSPWGYSKYRVAAEYGLDNILSG